MRISLAVRVRGQLQYPDDVIHVVEVGDGVVDGADDLHGVRLQQFAVPHLRNRRYVFHAREHRLQVGVRLKHPAVTHEKKF